MQTRQRVQWGRLKARARRAVTTAAATACAAAAASATVVLLTTPTWSHASTWTWTGGGVGLTNGWSSIFNWSPTSQPQNSADTQLIFAGTTGLNPNNNVADPFTLNSLSFAPNAGAFSISGGSLVLQNSSAAVAPTILQNSSSANMTMSNAIALPVDTTFGGTGTHALTISGNLSGSGTLIKTGPWALILDGINTNYTSTVRVDGGEIRTNQSAALAGTTHVIINTTNGLDLNGLPAVGIGAIDGSGNINLGVTTLTSGDATTNTTYSGNFTSTTGGFTKTGADTIQLSGTANSIGGSLTINQGTLVLNGGSFTTTANVLGNVLVQSAGSTLILQNGAHLSSPNGNPALVAGGGATLTGSGTTWDTFGTLVIGASGSSSETLKVQNGATLGNGADSLIAGEFGNDNGKLQIDTQGQVSLDNATLALNAGAFGTITVTNPGSAITLQSLDFGNSLGSGGRGTVTLSFGGAATVAGPTHIYASPGAGNSNISISSGVFTTGELIDPNGVGVITVQPDPIGGHGVVINGAASGLVSTYAGVIKGTGSVEKDGLSTQVFSGNNSYTGGTVINAGTLRLGDILASAGTGPITVASGATFDLNGNSQLTSELLGTGLVQLGAGGGTSQGVSILASVDHTFGGTVLGGGSSTFTKSGSATLTLTSAGNSIAGPIVVNQGALVLDGAKWTTTYPIPQSIFVTGSAAALGLIHGAQLLAPGFDSVVVVDGGAVVALDGAGTLLDGAPQYSIGQTGQGMVTVSNGATLGGFTSGYIALGVNNGSNGQLIVNTGGHVVCNWGAIGTFTGSQGSANVSGAGSSWNMNVLTFGGLGTALGGKGKLNITGGASVNVAGITTIWDASQDGKFNIGVHDSTFTTNQLQSPLGSGAIIDLFSDPVGGEAMLVNGNSGITETYAGVITGPGTFHKGGSDTLIIQSSAALPALTHISGGVVELRQAINGLTSNLSLDGTGMLRLAATGGNFCLVTPSVSITGGSARLDLEDNKLIVHGGSTTSAITALITSGRNGGNWNGSTGIITAQTAAIGSNYTTLGVARASDIKPATATATALWFGRTITGTDTLVMYTYGGDANLDGKINIDDYIKIDAGIASGLSGWSNGDFNYDGKINIDDYTQFIDNNINTQGPQFPASSSFIAGSGSFGFALTAIPEPAWGFPLLGFQIFFSLRRARRVSLLRRCSSAVHQ